MTEVSGPPSSLVRVGLLGQASSLIEGPEVSEQGDEQYSSWGEGDQPCVSTLVVGVMVRGPSVDQLEPWLIP